MYKVIVPFTDLQDDHYKYVPGDIFPRDGYTASEERIKELSTDANGRHRPMIAPVEATKPNEKVEKDDPLEGNMNKPVLSKSEPIEDRPKPKRGRKKKDAE